MTYNNPVEFADVNNDNTVAVLAEKTGLVSIILLPVGEEEKNFRMPGCKITALRFTDKPQEFLFGVITEKGICQLKRYSIVSGRIQTIIKKLPAPVCAISLKGAQMLVSLRNGIVLLYENGKLKDEISFKSLSDFALSAKFLTAKQAAQIDKNWDKNKQALLIFTHRGISILFSRN